MRYVPMESPAALLIGGTYITTLNPVDAQAAQNVRRRLPAPRAGAPMSFAGLVEAAAAPAVVSISTRQSVQMRQRQLPPGFEFFAVSAT